MTYTFPIYVPSIAAGVAVLFAAIGAFLIWKRQPLILALLVFGIAAVAGGIFVPTLARDRVVLDDEKLEQTTGFWFSPTVKGFRLADLESVTIGTAVRTQRQYEVWTGKTKNGAMHIVEPGDLWTLNKQDIVGRLREKGIEVKP